MNASNDANGLGSTGANGAGGHDDFRVLIGGFVLGGLSDEEHEAFAAHVRDCPSCQAELAQVAGLPRLLSLGEPADEDGAVVQGSAEPVLLRLRRERRRRRTVFALASVAASVLLFVAGVVVGPRLGGGGGAVGTATGTTVTALPVGGSTASANVTLVPKAWGTQLEVTATSLPTSGSLSIHVVDRSGRNVQLATWSGTPAGRAVLTTAFDAGPSSIASIELQTAEGQALARAAL